MNVVQKRVFDLMNKGEGNLTKEEEKNEVVALGLAAQEYETTIYTHNTTLFISPLQK